MVCFKITHTYLHTHTQTNIGGLIINKINKLKHALILPPNFISLDCQRTFSLKKKT